jgi:hypothetical protein
MEDLMKTLMTALMVAGAVFAAAPVSAKTCIDTRDIVSSKSEDGKVMVFEMKNGQTLLNRLQGLCPDLRYNGFVWQLPSSDTKVCDNEKSFQVLQSGQVCMIGAFEPATGKQAMSVAPR